MRLGFHSFRLRALPRCSLVLLAAFLIGEQGIATTHVQGNGNVSTISAPSDVISLPAMSDVNGNVTVEAGLLPYSVSRRIFGTEIAKHYAIVQLVISNHDAGDALIVQSVFLDYSHWLFSGSFAAFGSAPAPAGGLTPFQSSNLPFQVASTESRLVRAELQDAQQWTGRNWVVRSAVLMGATAVGYQFLFGQDFAQGANAFSGALIPGLQHFWPDNLQSQINQISDFGFSSNHVIPKNSSDVVVGFFPLDRFLTPDLQKIFRKAPSAFFNPGEMLLDSTYSVTLLNILRRAGALSGPIVPERPQHCWDKLPGRCWVLSQSQRHEEKKGAKQVGQSLQHYEQFKLLHHPPPAGTPPGSPEAKKYQKVLQKACSKSPKTAATVLNSEDCFRIILLDKVSLTHIRVIASGIMAVDTAKVPAVLSAVQFASDPTLASTWASSVAAPGGPALQHTATLVGSFLSGGLPTLSATAINGTALATPPLATLIVDPLHSDDNHLVFTYTVPDKVPSGTQLSFTVLKKSKDGSQIQSAPLLFTVSYPEPEPKSKPAAGAGAGSDATQPPTEGGGGAGHPARTPGPTKAPR